MPYQDAENPISPPLCAISFVSATGRRQARYLQRMVGDICSPSEITEKEGIEPSVGVVKRVFLRL
jgi:hypothetical protein